VATQRFLLQSFDVLIELVEPVLPLFVEAVELVEVRRFYFLALNGSKQDLLGVPFPHIFFGTAIQFVSHLLESPLCGVCFDVLSVLLAGLLVVIEKFAEW